MQTRTFLLVMAIVAGTAPPSRMSAQEPGYPQTIIPPGKGPFSFPAGYQTPWEKIEIRIVEKMSPNLFVLHGSQGLDPAHPDASGGRAMVLFGPDGVLMVDTQNRQVAEKTLQAIRAITDGPLRILVNTHVHSDHTGANAFFAKQGALIYAQENLRNEMLRPPRRAAGAPPAIDPASVPAATYSFNPATPGEPAVSFYMNGETVDFIPMMPSHTAGDTIVRFRNANVIYIEDFYRNFGYPFADHANGGSLKGMLEGLNAVVNLAKPTTKIVPGHGAIVDKTAVAAHRDMAIALRDRVAKLVQQGQTQEQVIAAKLNADYDAKVPQPGTTGERFITQVYAELQGGK
jgi:glyoxylase-like metal-dependent hydrolase (beta-lactamase superfamily II)